MTTDQRRRNIDALYAGRMALVATNISVTTIDTATGEFKAVPFAMTPDEFADAFKFVPPSQVADEANLASARKHGKITAWAEEDERRVSEPEQPKSWRDRPPML